MLLKVKFSKLLFEKRWSLTSDSPFCPFNTCQHPIVALSANSVSHIHVIYIVMGKDHMNPNLCLDGKYLWNVYTLIKWQFEIDIKFLFQMRMGPFTLLYWATSLNSYLWTFDSWRVTAICFASKKKKIFCEISLLMSFGRTRFRSAGHGGSLSLVLKGQNSTSRGEKKREGEGGHIDDPR